MAAPNPVIRGGSQLEDVPHYVKMDETLRNAAGALQISSDGSRAGSGGQETAAKLDDDRDIDPEGHYNMPVDEFEKGYDRHENLEGGHAA